MLFNPLELEFDEAIEAFKNSAMSKDIAGRANYQIAKVYILKEDEINAVQSVQKAIDIDPTFRYKAEKEPLFDGIREYLAGMQMVSDAQMKLEHEIDAKVQEKYKKDLKKDISKEEVHFNYMDRFNQ